MKIYQFLSLNVSHFFDSDMVLTSHSIPSWRPIDFRNINDIKVVELTFFGQSGACLNLPGSVANITQFEGGHDLLRLSSKL